MAEINEGTCPFTVGDSGIEPTVISCRNCGQSNMCPFYDDTCYHEDESQITEQRYKGGFFKRTCACGTVVGFREAIKKVKQGGKTVG